MTTPAQAQPMFSASKLKVLALITAVLIVVPFLLLLRIDLWHGFFVGGIGWSGIFYALALFPGAASIIYHVLSASVRRQRGRRSIAAFIALRHKKNEPETLDESLSDDDSPTMIGASIAALQLTAVFLLVAVVADVYLHNAEKTSAIVRGMQGVVFCGLGAYVAVVYYMIGRLYANALSTRFITASALRSVSALAIGWTAGIVGFDGILPSTRTAMSAFFLVGLFHNWAINAMRSKAQTWLGAPANDNEELPIMIIEGIEDTYADLLSEYGVTTIEHLVVSDPAELSERSLISISRILDWKDQALLVQRLKRNIASARAMGIRSATDLARLARRFQNGDANAKSILTSLAEKSSLGLPATEMLAGELLDNAEVQLIHEALRATELAPVQVEAPGAIEARVQAVIGKYVVTNPGGEEIGRLRVMA